MSSEQHGRSVHIVTCLCPAGQASGCLSHCQVFDHVQSESQARGNERCAGALVILAANVGMRSDMVSG